MPEYASSRPDYECDRPPVVRQPSCESKEAAFAIARCHDLLSDRAEVPGNRIAGDVLAAYPSLDAVARAAFFDALLQEFSVEPGALRRAAEDYVRAPSEAALLALRHAGEAPRHELFYRLIAAHGGTARLVSMRADLLADIRQHPSWRLVETDLADVLKSNFNSGLLEFQQIDEETPSAVLEKLIQYEAVHAIHSWREMRRRLEADRRCYAFFHPAWPDEPLIFTEVALTRGFRTKVGPILDPESPVQDIDGCDTAIFYSITNCQPGLKGLSFGNLLIGRAVDKLRGELPRLRTFATLSPIPGFRTWLKGLAGTLGPRSTVALLTARVDTPGWLENDALATELGRDLLPLCAYYLLHAKEGVHPADPVARFHLANGARLRRVDWLSDVSAAGLDRSISLMANYLYHPADLERNCHTYAADHKVNATPQLERMARVGARLCGATPDTLLPMSA